ncbi:MAG: protein-methionine-sulfoxide reductase heme-binding subunit MsrQ [Thauera sp.]|jgi:sulfoxide reductase heme-binding subunit YedZ|nr:protein-methionine-sulfoxide reductase heme-binding subunit MsrQ [Thauera sp.]
MKSASFLPAFIRTPGPRSIAGWKLLLFVLCLLPALQLLLGWQRNELGANPVETITRASGEWALRLLLLTLAVSPLRRYTGLHWLLRLRRSLGLFTFAYACAHLLLYLWLDQFFDWRAIARDILDRPFITIGMAAFVLLLPLALTSSNYAMRRLGGQRWRDLHRSVYAIAIFAVIHYWWLVKADWRKPLLYALIVAALLGVRAWWRELERRRQLAAPPPGGPPAQLKHKVIRIVPK